MGTRQSLKRTGALTAAEKNVIQAMVMDSPREVTPQQTNALAKALRRSRSAIKSAIEDAQAEFQGNAGRYVEIHKQALEAALQQTDDPKALEVAVKGAQWAIERTALDGARIIEPKVDASQGGPRVLIGIRLGGLDATKNMPVDVTATEVKE